MQDEPTGRPPFPTGPAAPVHTVVVPIAGLAALGAAVVATWLALLVLDEARTALVLLLGGAAVAVVLAPAVRRLGTWMPRWAAIVLLAAVGITGTIGVLGLVAWDLDTQADALSEDIDEAVASLPPDSATARIAAEVDLAQRAERVLDGLAAQVVIGDDDPLAIAGRASQVVLVAVLAAFSLTQGAALVEQAVRTVQRASIREDIHRTLRAAAERGGAWLRRSLGVAGAHGLAAGGLAAALGLPGSIALGAWVAAASLLPVLGIPLAWAPVIAVGWARDVPLPLLVATALLLSIADRVAGVRWVRRPIHVGPILTLVGIGAGLYAMGLPGAVLGLLAVAALAAAFDPDTSDVAGVVEHLVDEVVPVGDDDGSLPELEPALVEASAAGPVLRLQLSRRTAAAAGALVLVVAVALRLLDAAQGFVIWLVVGGFVAIGLDRPVSAVARRTSLPRPAAVAVVLGSVVGAVVAVGWFAGPSVTDSADEIVADAPAAVRSLESLPLVGPLLESNDVSERLEEEIAALPDRLRESDVVERAVAAAGDGLLGALWITSLVIAILLDGPRLVGEVARRVRPRSRRAAIRFGRAAHLTVSNIAAATAFVAVLNGTVVMLIAVALGVPLPPVLGLWATWWNVIPQVGGFVGAAPLVLLAVGQGPWHGVIALVTFVSYQTLENHVIQPAIGGRAARLPPMLILLGVLIGGSLFGFVGAILAGPTLGVAKAAVDQLRGPPGPRIEDREPADA
ncbi:AI-2E family transporter [Actinomarinicola tropica]|nr:AI-2E family transporter [Actinomarinicola tropica]